MNVEIPKIIHFCWFGGNKYNDVIKRCMKSWPKYAPNFEIKKWDEETYDLKNCPDYVKNAYQNKKWAFVSDYVRLDVLRKFGGVYLDTDQELVRDITPLLKDPAFIGFEDDKYVASGILAAVPHHQFIERAMKWYEEDHPRTPTPIVMTSLLEESIFPEKIKEEEQTIDNVKIYPRQYFYPFNETEIKDFSYQKLGSETYAVHFWNYSWGHPLNRFFKKIGIYDAGKRFTEKIGLKNFIKKVLRFE